MPCHQTPYPVRGPHIGHPGRPPWKSVPVVIAGGANSVAFQPFDVVMPLVCAISVIAAMLAVNWLAPHPVQRRARRRTQT
ncbi:hypothetical protein ATI53_102444 [Salipiger aestuarii]|uniref:Uncharacterized protein n=1 Tax=Salipiger aestuarii TaxID=568098 RepID=A0A327Y270_9RHOB|nr:hypothetical protein ATI53_102444 [Salipiger aestuarii]